MSVLISQVLITWEVREGKRFELVVEGDDAPIDPYKVLDSYARPFKYIGNTIRLKDNTRIDLVLDASLALLQDRTGVLVVFRAKPPLPGASFYFPAPDNAAVINADGTLRFQVRNPAGPDGEFRSIVPLLGPTGPRLGVRACPKSYPVCESVYVVDGTTNDLSKQMPIWIRD